MIFIYLPQDSCYFQKKKTAVLLWQNLADATLVMQSELILPVVKHQYHIPQYMVTWRKVSLLGDSCQKCITSF